MKTYFDCIPCFVCQVLDSVRMTTSDTRLHEKITFVVKGTRRECGTKTTRE